MQSGSLTRVIRQEGPAVWQFRWSEKDHDGKRIYRKRIIGSADQYESREAAYLSVKGLLSEINSGKGIAKPTTLTMGTTLRSLPAARNDSRRFMANVGDKEHLPRLHAKLD